MHRLGDTTDALAVYTSPDVVKVADKPVPFAVHGKGSDDRDYSPDVRSNGETIKRRNSKMTTTYGAEPGDAGVKSGTEGQAVEPVTSSPIVRANGVPVQRHSDTCTLNNGNCPGEYVHVKSTETHKAPDGADKQDKAWYKKAWDDFHAGAKATSGTVETGEGILNKAKQYWNDKSQIRRDLSSVYKSLPTGSQIWEGTKNIAGGMARVAGEVLKDPVGSAEAAGGWAKDQAVGAWKGVEKGYSEHGVMGAAGAAVGLGVEIVNPLKKLKMLERGAEALEATGDLEKAAKLRKKAEQLKKEMEETEKARKADGGGGARSTGKPKTTGRKLTQEEYDRLRKKTPSQKLRDKVNEGQPDATPDHPVKDDWIPGKERTGPLAADHIVPMKKITEMDGFSDLTEANQLKVLNNPDNFTGLSNSANSSKGAKSYQEWGSYGTGSNSVPVNPTLRQEMIGRSNEMTPLLQKQIYDLLRSQ